MGAFTAGMPAQPLNAGLAAYAGGDWNLAASQAHERLKVARDDPVALCLLARASVRLGRDSTATAIYSRLGDQLMTAEDLCLSGIATARAGDQERAMEIWEKARTAEPDHAETLFELTRRLLPDGSAGPGRGDRAPARGPSRLGGARGGVAGHGSVATGRRCRSCHGVAARS